MTPADWIALGALLALCWIRIKRARKMYDDGGVNGRISRYNHQMSGNDDAPE